MKDFNQEDIEFLDRLATRFSCKLYMPPIDNLFHPFFLSKEVSDVEDLAVSLCHSGFSFEFKGNDYLMVTGG